MKKFLLLDGHSLAYRAFYALPVDKFATSTGQPTNAIYGFCSMLVNLLADQKPDQVIDSNGHTAYLWKVPAQVGGGWTVSGLASDGKSHASHIHFDQRYQRLSGTMTVDGKKQVLLGFADRR